MRVHDSGWLRAAVVGAVLAWCTASPVWAQRANPKPGPVQRDMAAAEIQRLFGAYAAIQAQDFLRLDDERFGRFLPRFRALQETRRRLEVARNRITAELARLTGPAQTPPDDAVLKDRLKALADLDVRAAEEIRAAYDGVDQTLDILQQARFRVFELQMERRKFELMLRARRGDAGRLQ